jgi:hypothetical protein
MYNIEFVLNKWNFPIYKLATRFLVHFASSTFSLDVTDVAISIMSLRRKSVTLAMLFSWQG